MVKKISTADLLAQVQSGEDSIKSGSFKRTVEFDIPAPATGRLSITLALPDRTAFRIDTADAKAEIHNRLVAEWADRRGRDDNASDPAIINALTAEAAELALRTVAAGAIVDIADRSIATDESLIRVADLVALGLPIPHDDKTAGGVVSFSADLAMLLMIHSQPLAVFVSSQVLDRQSFLNDQWEAELKNSDPSQKSGGQSATDAETTGSQHVGRQIKPSGNSAGKPPADSSTTTQTAG